MQAGKVGLGSPCWIKPGSRRVQNFRGFSSHRDSSCRVVGLDITFRLRRLSNSAKLKSSGPERPTSVLSRHCPLLLKPNLLLLTSRDPQGRQDERGHHVHQLDSSGCAPMEYTRTPWLSRQRCDLAVDYRHCLLHGGTHSDEVYDHQHFAMGRHLGHLRHGTNDIPILMSPPSPRTFH